VLTGSARLQQEARDREVVSAVDQTERRALVGLERRRRAVERQISALREELAEEERETKLALSEADARKKNRAVDQVAMSASRRVNGRQLSKTRS
jgi:circadian clock protein KaiC